MHLMTMPSVDSRIDHTYLDSKRQVRRICFTTALESGSKARATTMPLSVVDRVFDQNLVLRCLLSFSASLTVSSSMS